MKMIMTDRTWEGLAVEANYRPRELATLCKVSLRTLQRHFASNYRLTVSGWMREVRLKQAYERIVKGEQIKAVAYDLGFKQLSHFSRAFKQVHGVCPRMVSRPGNIQAIRLITIQAAQEEEDSFTIPRSEMATVPVASAAQF